MLTYGLILLSGVVLGALVAATASRRKLREATERADRAELLRAEEERFKSAYTANPAALVISRMGDETIVDLNETFAALLGYSVGEIRGRSLVEADILNPADRDALIAGLRSRETITQTEVRLNTKDGQSCWLLVSARRIELEGQECILWAGLSITNRKRHEESLRRSETQLAQAVSLARLGTFDHDLQSGIIQASPEMKKLYEFATEPVTAAHIAHSILPEDKVRVFEAVGRANDPAGDGVLDIEHRIVVNHAVRWVRVLGQTFFIGEGEQRRAVRRVGTVREVVKPSTGNGLVKAT